MSRRHFISALAWGLFTVRHDVQSQPAAKIARIGVLTHATAEQSARLYGALNDGLRNLGYVENRNVVLLPRYGDGTPERLPELAAELVRLRPDVIVAGSQLITIAAKRATPAIPIVMVGVADPVGTGLVSTLARPGGNVTGLSIDGGSEMGSKGIELLREMVPGLSRIGVLRHPIYPATMYTEIELAARQMSIEVEPVEIREVNEIEAGFARMRSRRVSAAIIMGPFFWVHRQQVAELALRYRLPAFQALRDFADAGLLATYGANLEDLWRRAASYVDRIVRGARPGELPVEQPTRFDLVINLRTAKALGIKVPQTVLARAELIQ